MSNMITNILNNSSEKETNLILFSGTQAGSETENLVRNNSNFHYFFRGICPISAVPPPTGLEHPTVEPWVEAADPKILLNIWRCEGSKKALCTRTKKQLEALWEHTSVLTPTHGPPAQCGQKGVPAGQWDPTFSLWGARWPTLAHGLTRTQTVKNTN